MEKVQFDPTSRKVQRDPYPHYRRLRDEAPVYLIKPLQAYALTRYEDCRNTFLHPEQYSAKDFIEQAFGDLDPVPISGTYYKGSLISGVWQSLRYC